MEPEVVIRPLRPDDSLEELTELLHRAYAPLAARGMRFFATHQTVEQTRGRIGDRLCLVAELRGRLVGTITMREPHQSGGTSWYDRPDVATFEQFCVDPDAQGHGIGRALLTAVEEHARAARAGELALDTAEQARDLIEMYQRWGYRVVGEADWDITNYRSVVLSKRLS